MILLELFLFLLFVLLLVLLFYFHNKNRENKAKIVKLQTDYDLIATQLNETKKEETQLGNKLDSKQTELINFALNIIQKNDFLEKIKMGVNEIKNFSKDTKTIQKLNDLSLSINQHIAIDKNRKNFQLQLEEANQDFYLRLNEKYPTLTDKEKRLASYLRLMLNSKEIASLLNITDKSVDMNRYRLRKKMSLPASINLVEFILTI